MLQKKASWDELADYRVERSTTSTRVDVDPDLTAGIHASLEDNMSSDRGTCNMSKAVAATGNEPSQFRE